MRFEIPRPGPMVLLAAATATLACTSAATTAHLRAAETAPEVRAHLAAAPAPRPGPTATAPGLPVVDEGVYRRPELAELEAAALQRSPSLVAAAHRVRALIERARAEGKLPAPEVMAEIWQVPFAKPYALDKAGMIMFSVRQAIPAAGSLDRAAEASALEARAEAARLTAEARALVHAVDRTFADYLEAVTRHAIHMAHRTSLDQLGEAARARYATGASLSDIAKADLERARVAAEMEREHGMVQVARARLNGLLARPADAWLGPPDPDEPRTTSLTPAEASALAATANPDVSAAELMEQSAHASAHAAGQEARVPAFGVSFETFLPVNNMPAGYGTSFSMSLPWVWGGGAARARSAEQRALAERASAEGARVRVRADAVGALATVRAAERRYRVLHDLAVPAARRALDAARLGYAGGGGDILGWLDAARSSLDVDMDVVSARADLDRALADLDWSAGGKVPRIALSASKEQLDMP
jgi:outer membrane protein TolC